MSRKTVTCFKRITAVLSSVFLASAAFAGAGLIANASATSITRISGNTRHETMEMVSQTAFLYYIQSRSRSIRKQFPDALAASSSRGISMHRFYSLTPKRFPMQQSMNLIDLTPIRFTSLVAKMRFQATLKMKSEHLVRQQLLHDSQGALASIPHIKSITNSPSSE